MTSPGTLKISTLSDREIRFERAYDAPRPLVFECHAKPELLRQWLLGPPGWTMPVCEIDLRVGGAYRYVWHRAPDTTMGMRGVFSEIRVPERIVASERFDEAWYPGEAMNTTEFAEAGGRTLLTVTTRYESRAARDAVLATGMQDGVTTGYDRLATLLLALTTKVRA